jgi:hypothetical protein
MTAEVDRVSSVPLPQLAAEVITRGFGSGSPGAPGRPGTCCRSARQLEPESPKLAVHVGACAEPARLADPSQRSSEGRRRRVEALGETC